MLSFSQFPHELLLQILKYLNPKSLVALSATNKFFNQLSEDNELWQLFIKQYFSYLELNEMEKFIQNSKDLFITEYAGYKDYGTDKNLQMSWILNLLRDNQVPPVLSEQSLASLTTIDIAVNGNGIERLSNNSQWGKALKHAAIVGNSGAVKLLLETPFAQSFDDYSQEEDSEDITYQGEEALTESVRNGHLPVWDLIAKSTLGDSILGRKNIDSPLGTLAAAIACNRPQFVIPTLNLALEVLYPSLQDYDDFLRSAREDFEMAAEHEYNEAVANFLSFWIKYYLQSQTEFHRKRIREEIIKETFTNSVNKNLLETVKTFLWHVDFRFSSEFIEKLVPKSSIDVLKAILVNANFKTRKKYHNIALAHAKQEGNQEKLTFLKNNPVGVDTIPAQEYLFEQRALVPQQALDLKVGERETYKGTQLGLKIQRLNTNV